MRRARRAAGETATVAGVEALLRAGALERAERTGRAVLRREPGNPDAWHLHALVAIEAGKLAKARSRLDRALAIRPDRSVFHSNLGAVLERLGDLEGARRAHERALALDRAPADNWFNHGLILLRLGRPAEAVASLEAACRRAPRDPEARLNLGRALERSGDAAGALREYRNALAHAAGAGERWARESKDALRRVLAAVFPVEAAPDIRRLLLETGVTAEVGPAAAAQLRTGRPSPGDEPAVAGSCATAGGAPDPLLLAYLRGTINLDPSLERWCAAMRRDRLRAWSALDEAEAAARAAGREGELVAALAAQCFANEFAWPVKGEEEARLAGAAAERVEARLAGDGPIVPAAIAPDLLLVSLYRPLNRLAGAERLAEVPAEGWSAAVADLLRRSLHEPLEERSLARNLPALAPIRDTTSRAVRAQYEENPYPRWLSLPPAPDTGLAEALAERFPERASASGGFETVLVAGGGTGYEPLVVARRCPRARVLSLDLSRTSLAYGARMARRLGIDNVRFLQGDLLEVAELGERFDLILATGVLHHMAEPSAGLGALAGVLRGDGIMKVGLYSHRAREVVARARDAAAAAGWDGSPAGIRAFRRAVIEGDRPELSRLLRSADFYTTSSCRDLVFHVHERRLTLPELGRALAGAGLRPLGFEADREIRTRYLRRYPADPHLRSLDTLAEFESHYPEAFAGMYLLWVEHGPPDRGRGGPVPPPGGEPPPDARIREDPPA